MAFFPQVLGSLHWPNPQIRPPGLLIAKLVELSMMASAQRNSKFVADFEPQRSGLRKLQMMRIGRLPSVQNRHCGDWAVSVGLASGHLSFSDKTSGSRRRNVNGKLERRD